MTVVDTNEAGAARRGVRGSRRVTLKRSPVVRPLVEADLKWLGAAWRKGALDGLGGPFADRSLSAEAFVEEARAALGRAAALWMLEAPVGGRTVPVGLVVGAVAEHRLEPHVCWFPWSSLRNRLECTVKFLNLARRDFLVIVVHRPDQARFFEAVAAHGLLRRLGVVPGYYADASPAMVWWGRRPMPVHRPDNG